MPVIDTVATGANIKARMTAAGKTVKDVQNACGFTTGNAVYKWINGICMPTIDNMVIIANTSENEGAYYVVHLQCVKIE